MTTTLELKHAFRCPGTDNRKGLSQQYYITSTFYLYSGDRPGNDTLYRHAIGIARDAVRVPSLGHAWQLMPPKKRKKLYREERSEIERVAAQYDLNVDAEKIMAAMEDIVDKALVAARRRCIDSGYIESDHDWWPDRHGVLISEIGAPKARIGLAA